MNPYKEIKLDKFYIVGISTRTTNANGQAMSDIAKLWKRFFTEQIAESICNKVSDDIYCVYTNYESDYTGEYTTILGCKVSSINHTPEDLVTKEIQSNNYFLYISERNIAESVGKTWMNIWQEGKNINRNYDSDFDVYGKDESNTDNAIVKTYLSIK